jgi:hypothetical protein
MAQSPGSNPTVGNSYPLKGHELQILRNTPATLELQVYQSGDLIDLDVAPVLAVVDANGDPVTAGTVSSPSTGVYRADLPAQADLKALRATWTGLLSTVAVSFTQHHEIVGNLLFTEAEARGARFTGQQSPLSSGTAFPDAVVARMRELIGEQFESKTSRSWTSRYCRTELHGNGSREISLYDGHPRDVDGNESGGPGRLWDVRRVISVKIDDVAYTEFALHGRRLINTSGTWPRATAANPFNIVVEYEYGHEPVPLEAQENGLRMVVANLIPSDVPDYAQTLSVGNENYSYQQNADLLGSLRVWPERTREWLTRHPARRIPVVA